MFISLIVKVYLTTSVTNTLCCEFCTAVRSCGMDMLDWIASVEAVMHEINSLENVQHPIISMHKNSFYSEEVWALLHVLSLGLLSHGVATF